MQGTLSSLRMFVAEESGATAIEYGLIAALVSVAAIGALRSYGSSLANLFGEVDNALTAAEPTQPSQPPPSGGGGCSPAEEAAGVC